MSRAVLALPALLLLAACQGPPTEAAPRPDAGPPGSPHMVLDLNTDLAALEGNAFPSFLTPVGARVAFTAFDQIVGPGGLWVSDGSEAGTLRLRDFDYYPHFNVTAGDTVFTLAGDDAAYGLYKSDGTPAGTVLVRAFEVLEGGFGDLITFDDAVVFVLGGTGADRGVWRSDGSAAGTVQLASLPGAQFAGPVQVGGDVYFIVETPALVERGLWISDGTPAGSKRLTFFPANVDVTFPLLTAFGGALYFQVVTSDHGELWTSDGTTSTLVAALPSGRAIFQIVAADSRMYLVVGAANGGTPDELWTSDGTAAGTTLVHDLPLPPQTPNALATVVGDRLFFVGPDALWASDGTAGGTAAIAPLVPDLGFGPVGVGDDLMVLPAGDGTHGVELWRSDGTAAGTRMAYDLVAGGGDSRPNSFTPAGEQVFFVADDGVHGSELWVVGRNEL